MNKALSPTQTQVLAFMVSFFDENDQLPPAASIAEHFKWASANAAAEHVHALERKGVIERNAVGKFRFRRPKDA